MGRSVYSYIYIYIGFCEKHDILKIKIVQEMKKTFHLLKKKKTKNHQNIIIIKIF